MKPGPREPIHKQFIAIHSRLGVWSTVCTAAGDASGELQLSDLIRGLGESRKKLGAARKALERLERRGRAVAAPLPGNVAARQARKAAYDVTSADVSKWQAMVKVRHVHGHLVQQHSKPARATATRASKSMQIPHSPDEESTAPTVSRIRYCTVCTPALHLAALSWAIVDTARRLLSVPASTCRAWCDTYNARDRC